MKWFSILFKILISLALNQIVRAEDPQNSLKSQNKPHCFNSQKELETIHHELKINSKNSAKYSGYQNIMKSLTSEELLKRLIYAESLAANCEENQEQVVPIIFLVIQNRINLRRKNKKINDPLLSVIFEKNQFSSSLNIYKESRYKDFLCPQNLKLWNLVEETLNTPKLPVQLSLDSVHYFLYKHSIRWPNEPKSWNRFIEIQNDKNKTISSIRHCIRVFKNPNWK